MTYTFPDELPELSAAERTRMNHVLLTALAQALGWSRVPG